MESIYYAFSWACHRKCVHCYEDRFRPYVRETLSEVVEQARLNTPRVVDNLPDSMRYLDLGSPKPEGGYAERVGRVILSGGEVLVDPVREQVLYPLLTRLGDRYRGNGGVKVVVQTTGDLLTETIIDDLLSRGVWMISVAGMDDYHVGMEGSKRDPLQARLVRWFETAGLLDSNLQVGERTWLECAEPCYSFFGATPDAWIGKLWPRGRAWSNGLSTADIGDNFCNRWSGGLGFLNHRYSGSEVAVDPAGEVYPCCMKTKVALGSLLEERLLDILDSLVGHHAFEAINMGHPERMGLAQGWDLDTYYEKCETVTPKGKAYRNLCIGCDRFHQEVLGPVIAELRAERLRHSGAAHPVKVAPPYSSP